MKWIAVRPICEHLGLHISAQMEKLQQDDRFNCAVIRMVAEDGKDRETICLNQNELLGWLYTINPNKVKAASRPLLLAYQKETTQAIHDYWTAGQATRPNVAPPHLADPELVGRAALRHVLEELDSNAARFERIEQRLDETPVLGTQLGKIHALGQQLGKLVGFRRAWTLFNNRFGLASYRDLPNREYEAALQFLRHQIISYGGNVPDRLL
ncbi:phage antirepressor N-terminal domain-containing protein [Deinococcus lacus]|uniref:Phage antirepressor N-terminal domain-containing protein n=1 Tax=Deinococcus lacus TaxID=392561 RepID=A0ABW1YDS0_9DEIO